MQNEVVWSYYAMPFLFLLFSAGRLVGVLEFISMLSSKIGCLGVRLLRKCLVLQRELRTMELSRDDIPNRL